MFILHDLHRSTSAQKHQHVVELSRPPDFSFGLDASSTSLLTSAFMTPQCATKWNRKFRNPLAYPSKLAGFPMVVKSIARASFCVASNWATRVSDANVPDSAWRNGRSRTAIQCCSMTAPETTNRETFNKGQWSTTLLRYHVGCEELLVMDILCVLASQLQMGGDGCYVRKTPVQFYISHYTYAHVFHRTMKQLHYLRTTDKVR